VQIARDMHTKKKL